MNHLSALLALLLVFSLATPVLSAEGPKAEGEKSAKAPAGKSADAPADLPPEKRSDDQLLADLDSGDPARQSAAARELGQRKSERAIADLVAALGKAPTAEVRRNAAAALGRVKKAGPATAALLKAAREDRDATVRYAALVALANIQDKDRANDTLELMKWTRDSSNDEFARDLVTRLLARLEKGKQEKKEEPKASPKDEKKAPS